MRVEQRTCPVCGKAFKWTAMRTHWEDNDDDAHRKLASEIERESDDAYFQAELYFIEHTCKRVP